MKIVKNFFVVCCVMGLGISNVCAQIPSDQKKTGVPLDGDVFATVEKIMETQPAVTNRVEYLYDENKDKRLQRAEIIELFEDVISIVERKGFFAVCTEALKEFDANKNGEINREEIWDIKKMVDNNDKISL